MKGESREHSQQFESQYEHGCVCVCLNVIKVESRNQNHLWGGVGLVIIKGVYMSL